MQHLKLPWICACLAIAIGLGGPVVDGGRVSEGPSLRTARPFGVGALKVAEPKPAAESPVPSESPLPAEWLPRRPLAANWQGIREVTAPEGMTRKDVASRLGAPAAVELQAPFHVLVGPGRRVEVTAAWQSQTSLTPVPSPAADAEPWIYVVVLSGVDPAFHEAVRARLRAPGVSAGLLETLPFPSAWFTAERGEGTAAVKEDEPR